MRRKIIKKSVELVDQDQNEENNVVKIETGLVYYSK